MRYSSSVSIRLFGLLLMSRMEIRTKSRWNLIVTVVRGAITEGYLDMGDL